MKLYTNKKYNTIALYAILVLAVNVLLIVAILKFDTILNILSALTVVLMPIIWGTAIAFLINPMMVFIEKFMKNKLFKKYADKKWIRPVSVTISSIIFLGIVVGIISVIIPELIKSVNEIATNFSSLVTTSQKWINKLFANYPEAGALISEKLVAFGTDLGKIQPMIENILSGAIGFVNVVKNFLLGFILSIYLLFGKETLLAQVKKIMFAHLKKSTCEKTFLFLGQANKTFSGFITGKIIDSIIIGIICFIVLTIINMPYNILISVIVGVTNVIPFFGPFIGVVPSAFLILLVEPGKTIWLILAIFLIQQFDGYVLGPKILGDSTGLPALWVMVSLFIGGGLFGFVGMLLAVPVFALIYSVMRTAVDNKLRKKKMPVATRYYKDNKHILKPGSEKRVPLTPEQLKEIDLPPLEEVNEAIE